MGKPPPPAKRDCVEKYFEQCLGGKKEFGGKHPKWIIKGSPRPFTLRHTDTKEVPSFYLDTNLRNIGLTYSHYRKWAKENC